MNDETPPRTVHAARVALRAQERPVDSARHRACRGTTESALRDFRDGRGVFTARKRSHASATNGADRARRGKVAAIPFRCLNEKFFYINSL